jgi:uncharacterized protein (TIGR03437 family)
MPRASRIASPLALFCLSFWLVSFNVSAQTGDRAQQLQEIVQLINRIKNTPPIEANLILTLLNQLEEKELAFISPTVDDKMAYSSFLQQPDTGMIRLMPREDFDGVLASSGGGAYYSFARLTHLYDFGSDLSLERGSFKVGFAGADFGFLVSLGDVAVETLTTDSVGVQYLATYKPPSLEAEARAEYQRSSAGFQIGNFNYRTALPTLVNQTYAVRSVSYGRSDCLVIFRVLRKDTDGSLIVLWKRLRWFPTPQLGGGSIAITSAASYARGVVAPESMATAFIPNLSDIAISADRLPLPTSLAGISIDVRISRSDTINNCCAIISGAKIFSVSQNQINFEISHRFIAPYYATIRVRKADGTIFAENIRNNVVAPALFTANANGQGAPAAVLLRIQNGTQTYEPVARFDSTQGQFVALPLDLGVASDQVVLVLFGTGIRWWHKTSSSVKVTIGGIDAPVLFAGEQGAPGLDQINVLLPRALAGRGEVDVVLTVDGKLANAVRLNIK